MKTPPPTGKTLSIAFVVSGLIAWHSKLSKDKRWAANLFDAVIGLLWIWLSFLGVSNIMMLFHRGFSLWPTIALGVILCLICYLLVKISIQKNPLTRLIIALITSALITPSVFEIVYYVFRMIIRFV
jgi:hypothetical protein